MGQVKETDIKNQNYYFFNGMINIDIFYSNLLKIGTKVIQKN